MIYLDNAATTYPKPKSVYERMDWANRNLAFNAGRGSYSLAKEASKLIDETRELIIQLVKGNGTEKAVLTTSATEALNIILQGINWQQGDIVFISPFEHNAVARVLEKIKNDKNIKIELLPLTDDLREIDLEKTNFLLSKYKPKCVCCTHVSNVTGYILPIEEFFKIAHQVEAITVLDASQSMGLIDIDVKSMNADFIAFAGHKTLYGPLGVGGFIDVNSVILQPMVVGGTGSDSLNLGMPKSSPERYEAGSKNIIAIAGLNAALKDRSYADYLTQDIEMTDILIRELKKIRGVILYQRELPIEKRVGVISFNVIGYKAEDIGMILDDEYGIAVRTGYHCAPYIHEYIKDEEYLGTVRIGIGRYTQKSDIESLVGAINEIIGDC